MQPLALPALKPVRQRHQYDCSVACLATILGLDYEVIEDTALSLYTPRQIRRGYRQYQVKAILSRLGYGVEKRRAASINLDEDTGILEIELPKITHDTILFNGCIYDPSDGQFWDASAYLAAHKASLGSLFVITSVG